MVSLSVYIKLYSDIRTYSSKKYTRILVHIVYEVFSVISFAPLFETMRRRHISSYALAKAGFSRATYYAIKSGKSISTNTVNQLCKLLDCNVSDIMTYINDEELP